MSTRVDVVVESAVSQSARARQLEGMFDVPRTETQKLEWHGDFDLDAHEWNVGLIVGPSGSGKSTIARQMFGETRQLHWEGQSVVDDFDESLTMETIAGACQAVGFNTIPAWLRPYDVLSTGEQFRVDLARRLVEDPDPIVVDEFSSTIDRQVAQIGSHAVQKHARRLGRKFVAVTCHYDVTEWLQPDWVIEPATMTLEWRSVQSRPALDVTVAPVPYAFWKLFAPFHYLTNTLHRGARCFVLFVGERPAAFAGVLRRPHPSARNIMGVSRLVTLPDWQGLGLAFVLVDKLGAVYKAMGERLHTYPAHPALIRGFDRSPAWAMTKRPGTFGPAIGKSSTMRASNRTRTPPQSKDRHMQPPNRAADTDGAIWRQGSRPCAVFEYAAGAAERDEAERLLSFFDKSK